MKVLKTLSLILVILSASAFVCNAGAAGKYEVRHSGAYVAHVRVNFEYNGVWHSYETDDYTSGMTRVLEIPKGATKNQIIVKNAVFIATWNVIFQLDWETPQSLCFNIWGTTYHPGWEYWPC